MKGLLRKFIYGLGIDILDGGNLILQYSRFRYYDYYTGRWLVSVIEMEISEEWGTGKRYLNMDVENGDFASEQNKIYRKNVA